MSRSARKQSSTHVYHIVVRGMDRQRIFEDKRDYYKYLDLLAYYKKECGFTLFAYCLMSNHVHLLLQTDKVPIGTVMQRLSTKYSKWFNERYERSGHLQQERFYSEAVETEQYFCTVLRYIHQNPLKGGLEEHVGEKYIWTSFREYRGDYAFIVDTELALRLMGNRKQVIDYLTGIDNTRCLDVDNYGMRKNDTLARQIICELCGCQTVPDFQSLSVSQQERYITLLYKEGLTCCQMNRLTGMSRGVIRRILRKAS